MFLWRCINHFSFVEKAKNSDNNLRNRNHMILNLFDNNKLIQSSLYIYEGAVAIGLQVINDLINQNVKGKCIAHKK